MHFPFSMARRPAQERLMSPGRRPPAAHLKSEEASPGTLRTRWPGGGGGGYPAAPFPQTPIPSISNTITLTVMVQKVRSSPPPLQGQPLSGWAEAPNPPTQIRGEHPRPPGRLNSGAFRASNLKHSVRSVVSANRAGSGSERPFSPCQWHPPLPKTQRFFFLEHFSSRLAYQSKKHIG